MPFFEIDRQSRATAYALSPTSAVAALTLLRQQSFPQLIQPPRFVSRTRPLTARPEGLARLADYLSSQAAAIALLAALVLILVISLPAWASFQRGDSAAALSTVRSSAGVTGTAATRVEDLGVATFVGRVPFVQQLRYLNGLTDNMPTAQRFVEGARQATLAEYLQSVGVQVTLPYLNDAASTKQALEAAQAEQRAATSALAGGAAQPVWGGPALAPGTLIPATVTFYACISDGFCEIMANGQQVFEGAAACSPDLPFGTRFVINSDPSGRTFVCLDRGALTPTWVDVWFYNAADGWVWQSGVGTYSDITIVE
ncbi:MAG: hypothetical protein A2148_04235 [Chloroflexi bacterium RBG_16_68_14]|nr:MAG: hypothetical protein A2148_04235 [Chloroflexi bacterium RBG_16_68_14]